MLRTVGVSPSTNGPSNPAQPVKYETTLYSESGSIPRSRFNRKNSSQPFGNNTMNGRFTSAQLPNAAAAVRVHSGIRPVRRHSTNSGPSRNNGYSLAAIPSPNSTPANPGLRRAHASMPVVANAIAIASKLVNACTTTNGDSANSTTSHGRRRAILVSAHTVTNSANASQNAVMSK